MPDAGTVVAIHEQVVRLPASVDEVRLDHVGPRSVDWQVQDRNWRQAGVACAALPQYSIAQLPLDELEEPLELSHGGNRLRARRCEVCQHAVRGVI